jgi:hypothetical protein
MPRTRKENVAKTEARKRPRLSETAQVKGGEKNMEKIAETNDAELVQVHDPAATEMQLNSNPKLKQSKRREVTAAVPGMTVSQMRRLLAAVRTRLARQNELAPFSLVEEIAPGFVTWELCTRVAVGLHEKRTRSRTREKKAAEAKAEEEREEEREEEEKVQVGEKENSDESDESDESDNSDKDDKE